MEKYVYQKFILGCDNPENALKKGLGGIIFFKKDIDNEKQFKNIIEKYKNVAQIPPFMSIDQEGGRVERTTKIRPPRLSAREIYKKGLNALKAQSEEIAAELKTYGINLNFAPCVDVNTNPNNPIIGERAFSDNPEDVIRGAEIFIRAMRKYNVIPCIKHFPGHGDADKDSHLTLPVIDMDFETMKNIHIKPFEEIIKNGIEMVMAAHLYCKCFDENEMPASLSRNVIKYLRDDLKFNGVIITDDMVMKGLQGYSPLEACIQSIKAGTDMFIFRNSNSETLELIETLVKIIDKDEELKNLTVKSYERILRLKKQYKLIN